MVYRVEGFGMAGWLLLCESSTADGAEITANHYAARGWTVRVVEG
jgi:hypothetical protein